MKTFWVMMLMASFGLGELAMSESTRSSSNCFKCDQPPERFETVTLYGSEGKYLHPRDEAAFSIPGGWRYTKELRVKVQATYGSRLEVWVNDQLRDTLYVNASPYGQFFTLALGRTTDKVSVRNSGANALNIEYIKAEVVCTNVQQPPVFCPPAQQPCPPVSVYPQPVLPPWSPYPTIKGLPSHNVASWLASKTIELIESLRDDVDPAKEYVRYLLPIKLEAAKAYAVGTTHGDLSEETRKALVILQAQLVTADELLTDLMKRDTIMERVIELVAVKYEISQRLR